MALDDFIKKRDGDLDEQEQNFITQLPTYSATLGLEPAEETSVIASLQTHRDSFTAMVTAKADAKAAVSLNQDNKTAAVNEFRRIAKKIKSSTNYTKEIGEKLGIIGPDIPAPPQSEMKPALKGFLSGGQVVIEFSKENQEGVRIYSKRGTEDGFSFLATDTHSPYNDTRTKLVENAPEERQYYAYYFSDDFEIGQQSDVVTVVIP